MIRPAIMAVCDGWAETAESTVHALTCPEVFVWAWPPDDEAPDPVQALTEAGWSVAELGDGRAATRSPACRATYRASVG